MNQQDKERFLNYLIENQFLNKTQLKEIEKYAKERGILVCDALLEKDVFSDEELGQIIADFFGVKFVSLKKKNIDFETLRIIPEEVARRFKVIAFSQDEKNVYVATSNLNQKDLFELLEKKTKKNIILHYDTENDLEQALTFYHRKKEALIENLTSVEDILDKILTDALNNKASDIHFEPRKKDVLLRFRIDGLLHDILVINKELYDEILNKIKVDAHLRIDEHFSAQDGKIQKHFYNEQVDIRVSIVPIVDGEACVLRLLVSTYNLLGLSDLGLTDEKRKKIEEAFLKPYGMILSTGPTGSGKSTTMYAILRRLNTKERNIYTIEDPVEYDIEGINQIQVNPQTNLTFAKGLRSILRQDPDVIYVGEIRDDETAKIAIHAALTGHLVLSTLHTNDAPTAIPRLIDMGIEPFLVASSLNLVIAQRLVRKICEACRVSYTLTFEEMKNYFNEEEIEKIFGRKKEIRVYKGKGCPLCHQTGYLRRVGIFEVLSFSSSIQDLVRKKADASAIKKQAIKEGMETMTVDGLKKVALGITTIEEILRVTKT